MRKQLAALMAATLLALTMAGTALADSTVRVTGNTVDTALGENGDTGWWFNRDESTDTPFAFSLDEASLGGGSLYVQPIGAEPADKFVAEHFLHLEDAAEWESVSYDFLIAGDGETADADHFYLNVYANLPDSEIDNYYDCRFDYTPSDPDDLADFATATFAAGDTPTYVQARGDAVCPGTIADLEEGSSIRMFSLNVGDTSANDEGLGGYLDNVAVTIGGETTTYDFEVPLAVKDDCKNGGFADFGFSNQGQCVSSLQSSSNAGT